MKSLKNKITSLRHNNRFIRFVKKLAGSFIFYSGNLLFFFRKKDFNLETESVKKILFISLYFRGDVLFHTPVIKLLKHYFKNAEIDVWVKERSKEILENNPDVSRIIVFDGVNTDITNTASNISFKEKREFYSKLKDEKYDIVIDYTGLFATGLISFLLNPGYSIGKYEQRFGFFYNKFIDEDLSIIKGNLIIKYLDIIKNAFSIPMDKWIELQKAIPPVSLMYLKEENKVEVGKILAARHYDPLKPLITIHLTAGWDAKRWSLEGFSELIKYLLKQGKFEIAVIGNKYDKTEFQKIAVNYKSILSDEKVDSMFFEFPLNMNAALIAKSSIFIGSDSVPLHIAGAVGTPSIGLFGPTNPDFSNPLGDNHKTVYYKLECSASEDHQYCTRNAGRTCMTIDCMKLITVSDISNEIIKISAGFQIVQ